VATKLATASAVAVTFVMLFAGQPGTAHADEIRNHQWHLRALRVAQANSLSDGSGVEVAVVDSGVDPHPDLSRNLLKGASALPSQKDDGQGDPNGHGTVMASLIAAHGRSPAAGVIGIAPAAKILPIRDSDAKGRGDSVRSAEAIRIAIARGATIINYSGAVSPSLALQEAVGMAKSADALIVASAGSKTQDVVAAYPAAMLGVLSVGASSRSGRPASFTKPGKNVQLCAPGEDILGAKPNGKYSVGDGTSQAAAIVSGAAALVRAKFPSLSAPEVIHRLTATADDIGKPGRDDECGYGILNIVKALTAEVPPLSGSTSASPSAAPTPTTGDQRGEAAEPTGSKMPLVLGAVAAAVAILLALLVIRRRKTP
jgi:type VII secretion-associated serine protease mycosin